jgi:hypothetical protein
VVGEEESTEGAEEVEVEDLTKAEGVVEVVGMEVEVESERDQRRRIFSTWGNIWIRRSP